MEIWKPIPNFEGYYEASSFGKIKRAKNKTIYKDGRIAYFSETILKPSLNKKGYLVVHLSVKSKKHSILIHRLIAKTFIENPLNKLTINHIDCVKTNNSIENLEWLTNKENMQHAFRNGIYKERDKTTINNILNNRKNK